MFKKRIKEIPYHDLKLTAYSLLLITIVVFLFSISACGDTKHKHGTSSESIAY